MFANQHVINFIFPQWLRINVVHCLFQNFMYRVFKSWQFLSTFIILKFVKISPIYINFFSFINTPSLVGWGFTLEVLFLRCLFSVVPFPHILQQNKQMSFKSHWIVHSENMWEWPQVSDHVTKGTEYINYFIYVYMLFFICIWPIRGWSENNIFENI